MKPYIANADGSVEWQCNLCCEPILLFANDAVTVIVGGNGVVDGVLCEMCARKKEASSKEATDGTQAR
jgi:hypothetical protein